MITTVSKWGNSLGVRIPQAIAAKLSLSQNAKIEITSDDNCVIIKKVNEPFTLEELFAGYDSTKYEKAEIDWGKPVGKEIW
jgi:antitoxin MazE